MKASTSTSTENIQKFVFDELFGFNMKNTVTSIIDGVVIVFDARKWHSSDNDDLYWRLIAFHDNSGKISMRRRKCPVGEKLKGFKLEDISKIVDIETETEKKDKS
jgi:hypothetical protein